MKMKIKNSDLLENFQINQIVKGRVVSTFVILGFRIIANEWFAQLKIVNPDNHSETASGELALSLTDIKTID